MTPKSKRDWEKLAAQAHEVVQSIRDTSLKYPNGAPMFRDDGMMLDEDGNRSIFDDVDA